MEKGGGCFSFSICFFIFYFYKIIFISSIIHIYRYLFSTANNPVRQDCIKAMEELRSNYSLFYSQLLEFVNDLNNRLIPDAPQQLQYVTILPDILPEDDPDFQSGNEDSVIDRAFIVKKMTLLVLARTRQFVDEGSHGWYDDQAEKLNMWLGLVNLSLANLRLSDEESSQCKHQLSDLTTLSIF